MSNTSARLTLPYLAPSQAQKHVTHNAALQLLDLLVQPAAEGLGANTPPSVPAEGELWLLGAAPSGDWAGHAGALAAWVGNAWLFVTPQEGWQLLDKPTGRLMLLTGGNWEEIAPSALDNLDGLGVNTSHDATNRLAVSSPATLLSHEGAGHQLKINKAGTTDTASLLYQTGWSGRAEIGLNGSDDFSIKLSADGSTWITGLSMDAATGLPSAPQGLEVSGQLSGSAVMQSQTDAAADRVMTTGAFGLGATESPTSADIDQFHTPGFYRSINTTGGTFPPGASSWGMLLAFGHNQTDFTQIYQSVLHDALYSRRYRAATGGFRPWRRIWSEANTTVDANGFIKEASPIVRLFADRIEEPVEPVGAVYTQHGIGHYTLSDVEPLATNGWQIEVPQDANGNRLVFVETSYDTGTRTLTITTGEITWDNGWVAGPPKDIPEGRWVDLRFTYPDRMAAEDI